MTHTAETDAGGDDPVMMPCCDRSTSHPPAPCESTEVHGRHVWGDPDAICLGWPIPPDEGAS